VQHFDSMWFIEIQVRLAIFVTSNKRELCRYGLLPVGLSAAQPSRVMGHAHRSPKRMKMRWPNVVQIHYCRGVWVRVARADTKGPRLKVRRRAAPARGCHLQRPYCGDKARELRGESGRHLSLAVPVKIFGFQRTLALASGRLSVPECSVLKTSLRQGVGLLGRRFLPHVNRAASMELSGCG